MKNYSRAILVLIMTLCLFSDNMKLYAQLPQVVINEFLASNQNVIQDPDNSKYSDWVELYNTASEEINISGYFLSDNIDRPSKWQFPPDTKIQAQSYLLVWADGEDIDLHSNFKISKSGEELLLCNPDTIGIDTVFFGSQVDDISFGRLAEDLTNFGYFSPPSPGAENKSSTLVGITQEPVFSIEGGFYSGSVNFSFENSGEMEIYYSIDGTLPDNSSTLYSKTITIEKTTPVRAIAYESDKPPSRVITQTYFIDIPVNLPIISLATDPDNFFDDEIGIYITGVNGRGGYCGGVVSNVNQDWERPINIEFYEMDGDQEINQQAGVKIFGGCSRHRYAQKSLAFYARSDYGKGSFKYQFFKEKEIDKFETFILRTSADDQVYTMFRDAAAQQLLASRMDADYQAYQPVVVYLNGEYWGIHNLREKLNEHYAAGNFGVAPDDVNLLANDGSSWATAHGSNADYTSMMNFVNNNNLAAQLNYDKVKGMMDVDQYIDYMCGHMYLAERDWPGNNIKFWKANSGQYNRWRWINFDLDQTLTFNWITENMINKCTTTQGPGWPNPEWSTRLFRNLLKNQEFRNQFLNRYAWHMSTTFDSSRVISIIDSLAENIRPEIPNHINRWGGAIDPTGSFHESWIQPTFNTISLWEGNVDTMRIFARERQQHTVQNFTEHFGLSGASSVNVNLNEPKSGVLQLSGNRISDGFSGKYFNDVPVKLKATPLLGYRFSHWETQSSESAMNAIINAGAEWKYHDKGENLGTDWSQMDYADDLWASGNAQLGYGDSDETTIVSYGGDGNNKYITTYFRKTLELTENLNFQSCTISLLVDDGVIAYLNGTEIARINMPEGLINYLTTVPNYIVDENAFTNFNVPVELLIGGTNVLAVEVHQNNASSSDLSFDCEMKASISSGNLTNTYDSPDIDISFGGDITLTAHFEPDLIQNENIVIISEINYQSSLEHDTEDWIEIFNNSSSMIDMTGWLFTDSSNDTFFFPERYLLDMNEYIVLCRNSEKFLERNPSVSKVLGDFEFGLNSGGELIKIINEKNEIIDEVEYSNISPWPTNAGSSGYTIELVDVTLDNNDGNNWAAVSLHGTPGNPNSSVGISDNEKKISEEFALYENYPNPFNPTTNIKYSLNETGIVKLTIHNVSGQKIRTLVSKNQTSGIYQTTWNGQNDSGLGVSSGVYFYRLRSGNACKIKKMILIR